MKKQSTTRYIVSGRVTNQQKQPIVGLTVQAFDQDPNAENQLGKPAVTDEKGAYQIAYTDEDFRVVGKESGGADVIVRVFEKDMLLSETEPKRNAGKNVTINITIEKTEAAFRATLEEVLVADIILHVRDVALNIIRYLLNTYSMKQSVRMGLNIRICNTSITHNC